MSLSTRVAEAVVGNVKGRIEAGSRLVEVVEGLKGRAQVREGGRAVVLKGMRWSLVVKGRVGAREETPSACWAYVRLPCGSLAPWVMRDGESASRRVRRTVV